MINYEPKKIEKKWQKYWEARNLYTVKDALKGKKNFMLLTEFSYPSGNLHIGHWYAFSLPDILARYLRMNGSNVLYPTGFDAFGLPAENAAIKHNINPRDWTKKNIKYMTKQLKSMGTMFDWSRKVETIDPDYYKWTQWMFIQFYKKGLAYRAKSFVNWCPSDKTVLANEQVVGGCCERCGSEVVQKEIEQWMFKITDYAEDLIKGLEDLDWQETAKLGQINWIGRSEGAIIKFKMASSAKRPSPSEDVEVFTTRPDTLFGATFLVVSPEIAQKWMDEGWTASNEVKNYISQSLSKKELDRLEGAGDKTGVDAGIKAINPATKEEIPVWVADYVLGSYGTGAIMAVPAHDERDAEFAKKFQLAIREVIAENGTMKDSGQFNGMNFEKAKWEITKFVGGKKKIQYKLRDWALSRQRYWGVPIPMIYCPSCGYQPVPEKDLPVKLPSLKDFKPSNDGRSPLARAKKWLKAECPKCGDDAQRETDTMDTFVDSSWYFMRYTDPKNKKIFASKEKMKNWLPVPMYSGGAEHTTMHLLYARFFTKALKMLGYVDFNEPFLGRRNRGIILGPDGHKMSKSKGNVIDPDSEVSRYGADAVRMYLAFMGPFELGGPWNPGGINGVYRFLHRIWNFVQRYDIKNEPNIEAEKILNKHIKEIGDDINSMSFNTGVSGLMKLLNQIETRTLSKKEYEIFMKLLAPFAPHLAEEIWMSVLKNKKSVHLESWPEHDPLLNADEKISVAVQVNGRVRDVIQIQKGMLDAEVKELALNTEAVKKHIAGKAVKKVIYVHGKIVSVVV